MKHTKLLDVVHFSKTFLFNLHSLSKCFVVYSAEEATSCLVSFTLASRGPAGMTIQMVDLAFQVRLDPSYRK